MDTSAAPMWLMGNGQWLGSVRMAPLPATDRKVLCGLAKRVDEIAHRPEEEEKKQLWTAHNMLEGKRPMVLCFPEDGWNELVPSDAYRCSTASGRQWEQMLRRRIYHHEYIPDDTVIVDTIDIPHCIVESGLGVTAGMVYADSSRSGAGAFDPVIVEENDLEKLHPMTFSLDDKKTQETLGLAEELFGDILRVRLRTWDWWRFEYSKPIAYLRGLGRMYLDMCDNPSMLHRICRILRESYENKIAFFEENRLFCPCNENEYCGSGGTCWTEELPGEEADRAQLSSRDVWTYGESQELADVSPAMFEEFVLQYQAPLLARFGLSCYGCCEPLDGRWHLLKKYVPNLRRASVTPWADQETAAEECGRRIIFSRKPSPALLAMEEIDERQIREDIRKTLSAADGCNLEFIMKDTMTFRNQPQRLNTWTRIAKQEIGAQ